MESKVPEGLEVIYKPLESLKPYPRNARRHTKHQIRLIAESIRTFGFTSPVLIDLNNRIIAGHGRAEAAKLVGVSCVPTIRLDSMTEDQIRAYVIADNRLAEQAGWDKSILAIEFKELLELDLGFDVTLTGFEVPEIDLILQRAEAKADPEDQFDIASGPAVSSLGDMWFLGKHRILCGNAIDDTSYSRLLDKKRAAVVFTDPPYNVPIEGNVCGKGAIHHHEFPMASGEMDEEEFTSFLTSALKLLARYSVAGSVHFICMDWRHIGELLAAGKQSYESVINLCIWVKSNAGMGSFYRSRHELVFVFRNGEKRHRNNVQLSKYGRNRSNIWEYPSINSSKNGEEGNLLALHPTVKPVALVADALLDCSARGDVVLDSFAGSGTTLLAAERTGRICYGIELDPLYIDAAIKRWQRHTGDHAIHAVSGKRFDDVADECLGGTGE